MVSASVAPGLNVFKHPPFPAAIGVANHVHRIRQRRFDLNEKKTNLCPVGGKLNVKREEVVLFDTSVSRWCLLGRGF